MYLDQNGFGFCSLKPIILTFLNFYSSKTACSSIILHVFCNTKPRWLNSILSFGALAARRVLKGVPITSVLAQR